MKRQHTLKPLPPNTVIVNGWELESFAVKVKAEGRYIFALDVLKRGKYRVHLLELPAARQETLVLR